VRVRLMPTASATIPETQAAADANCTTNGGATR
jgi:hypothetical protein